MQPEATTLPPTEEPVAPIEEPPPAPPPPTYTRGELVWGYARGFPWWPCQIRSVRALKEAEPKVRIRFLRTLDNIELPVSSVKPYAPHVAEYSVVTKKMFKSAGPRKKFEEALQQAKEWAERGGPPPLPEGETEVWSDDDVVDDEDVEAAQKEAAAHLEKWREDGHELIGTHVSRSYTHAFLFSLFLTRTVFSCSCAGRPLLWPCQFHAQERSKSRIERVPRRHHSVATYHRGQSLPLRS